MNPLKLIATYSRVSTLRQEDEQTIQIQLDTLREYAEKSGYTIVKEYTDDGWSGDMLVRPALDALRQDAKSKLWDGVLIYDPDRLARRYSYQELLMDELKEAGIEVLFVTVSTPKNSEDKILHGVRGLFAEYERAKISERFRLGKLRRIREGHILVSQPLYGYTYIRKQENQPGYYVVNEDEAKVVKMIFTWVGEEGMTIRGVVARLLELGIRPRKSKRGVWSPTTLATLLKNKGVIGEARWGSSYAVVPEKPLNLEKYKRMKKTSRRMKPEEDWMTVPIPPIIDRELFDRVQQQLKANSLLCQRNTKNQYLLTGKIRCSCGKSRIGEGPQKGKHLYYRCSDRVHSYPLPPMCREGGINARIADELIWKNLAELMSSPELLHKQIERWINSKQDKAEAFVKDIGPLQKELTKLKEEENRYGKAYGSGAFTIEQLKSYTEPLKAKMTLIEGQIIKAQSVEKELQTSAVPGVKEIQQFTQGVVKTMTDLNFDAKREIVRSVIEKVVGNREKLVVTGYIPLEHFNVKTNDRHGWNTNRHVKTIPFSFETKLPPPQNLFGNK